MENIPSVEDLEAAIITYGNAEYDLGWAAVSSSNEHLASMEVSKEVCLQKLRELILHLVNRG